MKRLLFVAVVALGLAACGSTSSADIEGEWQLQSGAFDGQPITIVDDHPITLTLDGGVLDGTAACNGYGGTYQVSEGTFMITEMSWTEMACDPPETMVSEQEYLTALANVESTEIIDGNLIMTGSRTEMEFLPLSASSSEPAGAADDPAGEEPAALFGLDTFGSWELVSGEADGERIPIVPSHPITIEISEDGVGGTAACNLYGGVPGAGGFSVTEMACFPDEVMHSESAYLAALQRVTGSGAGGELVLTGDGVELVFKPLPSVPAAELLNTVWVLESMIQGDAVSSTIADTRATLELFSDGSFIGSTGCRTIAGSYQVSGAEVVFTNWGAEGDCPAELADQDSRVISALEGGFRVEFEADRMTTWVAGDEGLVYGAER